MSIVPISSPDFQIIDPEHFETLSGGVSALTIDPIRHLFYYAFPFVAALSSSYTEIRANDPTQEGMMPQEARDRILKEIEQLKNLAGIQRKILPYVALNHRFSSYGGSLSLTKPVLFLPHHHLFRHTGDHFGKDPTGERFSEDKWLYSDNQVRFLIARELGPIKRNNGLLRIAIKVALLVALFMIYSSPFGWLIASGLIVGALALYIISERLFEGRMDIAGAKLLGERLDNPQKATRIAIETLEKMRQQNLIRREQNRASRLYITKKGNNLLDLNHPFLTTRIARLQKHLKAQQEKEAAGLLASYKKHLKARQVKEVERLQPKPSAPPLEAIPLAARG